ncbi:MAG: arylesterase [Rhodospirillales bacterium]|nr:arylesterase [Rhodospirillales bacterium]
MAERYGLSAPSRQPGIARRALLALALLAAAPPPPKGRSAPRLLILGDSLTAGYGLPAADAFQAQLAAALAKAGHPVRIIDGAVSGDTTAGGLARLDWVLAGGADAAIVELGGNDGLRGLPPAATEKNLAAILDRLAARHIPVLLAGMYAPPNLGPQYEHDFRAVFDRLGARPGVIYEDFFLAGVATHPSLDQPDHIHPNAAGVRIVVARILPLVLKLLGEVGHT